MLLALPTLKPQAGITASEVRPNVVSDRSFHGDERGWGCVWQNMQFGDEKKSMRTAQRGMPWGIGKGKVPLGRIFFDKLKAGT